MNLTPVQVTPHTFFDRTDSIKAISSLLYKDRRVHQVRIASLVTLVQPVTPLALAFMRLSLPSHANEEPGIEVSHLTVTKVTTVFPLAVNHCAL